MVKTYGKPTVRRMASGAVWAKALFMNIIFLVAANAIFRSVLEVGDGAGVLMAFHTTHSRMLTDQREYRLSMVKIRFVGFHPIVTCETIRAISDYVCLHKCQIKILVTLAAHVWIKDIDAVSMAIGAFKTCSL